MIDLGWDEIGSPALLGKPRVVRVTEAPVRVVEVWSDVRKRYVRSHPCILTRDCPHCGAKRGEPCRGPRGVTGQRHVARLKDPQKK